MMRTLLLCLLLSLLWAACTVGGSTDSTQGPEEVRPGGQTVYSSPGSSSSTSPLYSVAMISIDASTSGSAPSQIQLPAYAIMPKALDSTTLQKLGLTWSSFLGSGALNNITWYQALLLCNKISKIYGYDTAYSYSSISSDGELIHVQIKPFSGGFRLPTVAEWRHAMTDPQFSNTTLDSEWLNDISDQVIYGFWPISFDSTSQISKIISQNPKGSFGRAGPFVQKANLGMRLVRSLSQK